MASEQAELEQLFSPRTPGAKPVVSLIGSCEGGYLVSTFYDGARHRQISWISPQDICRGVPPHLRSDIDYTFVVKKQTDEQI